MKKKIVRSGVGIGAAAAMSVGLSGCPKQPESPPPEEPEQVQTVDESTDEEPAATDEEPAAADEEPAATDEEPAATDEPGDADDTSASADDAPAADEPPQPAIHPDCKGKDQFTEKCGYKSPTKYAVLDPASILNRS
jgi:hypothetical protein